MKTNSTDKREVKFIDATPKIAMEWLAKNHRNRPFTPARWQRYADTMRADEWRFTPEPIIFCDNWIDPTTGKEYGETLMEGQHRAKAVVESGVTCRFTVWTHCDPVEFEVYGGSKERTASDILTITRPGLRHPQMVASICSAFLRLGLSHGGATDFWRVRRLVDKHEADLSAVVDYKMKLQGHAVGRQFLAALMLCQLVDAGRTDFMVSKYKFDQKDGETDPVHVLREYNFERMTSKKKDAAEVAFYKICNGIAAYLDGNKVRDLKIDTNGIAYLRNAAKGKLGPIMADLFGRVPNGFYSPKLSLATQEWLAAQK